MTERKPIELESGWSYMEVCMSPALSLAVDAGLLSCAASVLRIYYV